MDAAYCWKDYEVEFPLDLLGESSPILRVEGQRFDVQIVRNIGMKSSRHQLLAFDVVGLLHLRADNIFNPLPMAPSLNNVLFSHDFESWRARVS